MSTLTDVQLVALAEKAGATPAQAVILAAIAHPESGGSTTSHNTDAATGDNSYGLWQINMIGSLGPARLKQFGLTSNDQLFDPLTNARAAVALMKETGGFSPWSTYNNGAYAQYVSQAQAAAPQASAVDVAALVKNSPTSGDNSGAGGGGDLNAAAPQSVQTYLHDGSPDSTYGYLAAYIHDPQIGPILAKAAKEGWSQDRLFGAISKTKWWKTTSQSARTWQETQRLDPATARQQLAQEKQHIQQLAQSTLGSTFDPGRLNSMANAAIASNWSDAQLQAAIGAEFKYQGAKAAYEGAAGKTVDALQQLSSQYLVPISRSTMQQWSKQVLEGTSTTDDFQSYLQSQAESLYPTLTSALKSGQTVAQFADPYVQMASQILEKPVGDFNLMNPKWAKALNTVQPDGSRAPMALSDWGDYLRSTTDYQGTQQAQQQAAAFGQSLGNLFGKISTGSDMSGLNASTAVTTS